MAAKKPFPLRLDPALHQRLSQWAADEFRSVNAHIELLLRQAVKRSDRPRGEDASALPEGASGLTARPVKEKKAFPLRIDAGLYEVIASWAERESRSVNAQIEWLLYEAVVAAGRWRAAAPP